MTVSHYQADDVDLLLPSFRPVARALLTALKERGFDPVPRDTLRTAEEARRNAARGVGIMDSMHCYGAAMDVICGEHGWGCVKAGCGFYDALGEVAEALGLVWGGRWRRRDLPHVQCVRVADQPTLRELTSQVERDAFVAARLPGTPTPSRA